MKPEQELQACIDYAHGKVEGGNYEAACLYEYARQSDTLKRFAAEFRAGSFPEVAIPSEFKFSPSSDASADEGRSDSVNESDWIQYPWLLLLQCSSFPKVPWNYLSNAQRSMIIRGLMQEDGVLHMTPTAFLAANGVLGELNAQATRDRTSIFSGQKVGKRELLRRRPVVFRYERDGRRKQRNPRQQGQPLCLYALFTIDCRKTRKQLLEEFGAWLALPENQKLFRTTGKGSLAGNTGLFKDRLKDLAVCRLYRRLGFGRMIEFANDNRRKSPQGRPLPFHDARRGQAKKVDLSKSKLCADEASALKATARVRKFLREHIPEGQSVGLFRFLAAIS